jgi:hypothetical protein
MQRSDALRIAGLLVILSTAACSSGALPVAPSATGGAPMVTTSVPAAKTCKKSYTLSGGGGFIVLPSCFGFKGKMVYPRSNTNGTITATVTISTSDIGAYKKLKGTILFTEWVFTSSSSADSTISFYDTTDNPHDGCRLSSPTVKPSAKYYGDFEVPVSGVPLKKTGAGISLGGTTRGHVILGIPFVGTAVEAGVKNFVLFSTTR